MLSTAGDTTLGGQDFDGRVYQRLRELCVAQFGVDPSRNPRARKVAQQTHHQRVKDASVRAKHQLSVAGEAVIELEDLMGHDLTYTLTLAEFHSLVSDLLPR